MDLDIIETSYTFSCLTLAFLPKEYSKAFLAIYLVGKLSASACFALVWNITAELYPTNLRAQVCNVSYSIYDVLCSQKD